MKSRHAAPSTSTTPGFRLLIFSVAMATGCDLAILPSDPDERLITDDDRACDVDEDCILVDESCCSCNSNFDGGKTAIAVEAAERVEARRGDFCAAAPCPAAISNSATCCAETAACQAGRCEVRGNPVLQQGLGCS